MNDSIRQQTLKNSVRATGLALHTGKQVNLILGPGPVDSGIVFRRTDLSEVMSIEAHALNVGSTHMATSLSNGQDEISTIEHLMSAFSGLGVDNAVVEVNAAELPIMDGSAAPFVFLIQSAGILEQDAPKKFLRVLKTIRHEESDFSVELRPYEGFKLSYTLEYDHPVFAAHEHTATVDFSSMSFLKEVCRARTFGFLADIEKLQDMDLAKGGSLDNAIVVDDSKILNEDGLRVRDEFVKHKVLDAIGDLYLLGCSLIGSFHGHKSGHGPNNALLRKLLATPGAYEIVTFTSDEDVPLAYKRKAPLLD
ncbi:MAG: UDP-3-O-[3-hydroxymyristoyl] N-acetylglucosamine deacetylase [Candidatus Azotimanducaceae bacterium]|jgi:UDP-3-O-[3-hydroxymyristoyl] N-acetylglucosamine deacetylase|tara:strand:- start:5199 stop:6122 length:924 start_codon:yes stop_codon:yes gene_type:complete